jgi:hypothetical protein
MATTQMLSYVLKWSGISVQAELLRKHSTLNATTQIKSIMK